MNLMIFMHEMQKRVYSWNCQTVRESSMRPVAAN
jgi:hypothetical protein